MVTDPEAIKDLAIKGTDKLKDTTDKIRESICYSSRPICLVFHLGGQIFTRIFLLYIILKIKCVTQITFIRYLDIIKYIFLHKCYIRRYFQKQKTPLNEWSLLSLIYK